MANETSSKKTRAWTFRFETLAQMDLIRRAAKKRDMSANKWVIRTLIASAMAILQSPDPVVAEQSQPQQAGR